MSVMVIFHEDNGVVFDSIKFSNEYLYESKENMIEWMFG